MDWLLFQISVLLEDDEMNEVEEMWTWVTFVIDAPEEDMWVYLVLSQPVYWDFIEVDIFKVGRTVVKNVAIFIVAELPN